GRRPLAGFEVEVEGGMADDERPTFGIDLGTIWHRRQIGIRLLGGGAAGETPVVAFAHRHELFAAADVGGVIARQLDGVAAVVPAQAANGDRIAEPLCDRLAARSPIDLEDAAAERMGGIAALAL